MVYQRVAPAQTLAEVSLAEADISRVGFHPPEESRPLYGVAEFGFRYGYVEDFYVVLYDEEGDVAGQLNLEIEQGATFKHTWVWKQRNGQPVDMTGASALMQIRAEKDFSADHKASIASYAYPPAGPTPWFNSLDITAEEGKIEANLLPSETLQIEAGNWFYDLLIILNGERFRLTEGTMIVDSGVSTP